MNVVSVCLHLADIHYISDKCCAKLKPSHEAKQKTAGGFLIKICLTEYFVFR